MLKRAFDIVASALGLLFLLPLFVVVALAIKLDSPGPVFYQAQRVGKSGELFHLYKFRSMVSDADKRGPRITAAGDSRITGIGRFIRRTKIDELPQLINVLAGNMSLVGPRPEEPRYVALYTDEQRQVLSVRPGLTSPASLVFRYEQDLLVGDNWEQIYVEQIMPRKLAIDLAYVQNPTLGQDIRLVLRTIIAMFL